MPFISDDHIEDSFFVQPPNRLYLWEERTVFIGKLDARLRICQVSSCLIVSLGTALKIKDTYTGQHFLSNNILVPPSYPIEVDFGDSPVVCISLDILQTDYSALAKHDQRLLGSRPEPVPHRIETKLVDTFKAIYEQDLPPSIVKKDIEQAIHFFDETPKQSDPRVIKIMDILNKQIGENIPLNELADKVSTSPSLLQGLFRRETGMSIKKYRSWRRLFETGRSISRGEDLPQSAASCGFIDCKAFKQAFRSCFGTKPSFFFQEMMIEMYSQASRKNR